MAADVHLNYVDNVYCRVVCEAGILMELSEFFTFYAENYKFSPKYVGKGGSWDGKIRLINNLTRLVYVGLAHRIKKYCDQHGYSFSFDTKLTYDNVSEKELLDFIKTLNLPFEPRDYQIKAVLKSVRSKRRIILSPTSSGKSLIIYMIMRWYGLKTLLIVPTTGLVTQMASDIKSYGYDKEICTSIDGLERGKIKEDIVVTTWQALSNGKTEVHESWYKQFDVVIVDECHGAKAAMVTSILKKMPNVEYRFGTTGTLDEVELNQLTIEGLFGPQYKTITTREMIDQGYASKLVIKCIVLKYPEDECRLVKQMTYDEETKYLITHEKRNKFISNLVNSLKGNKLVFYNSVEHGDALQELMDDGDASFFRIDGSVNAKERERIRILLEEEENAKFLASLKTTATGVSVNRLHHMIPAQPSKSKIRVMQSIGRMLRLHEEKEQVGATLYDIVDDFSYGKTENYSVQHYKARLRLYDADKFEYKIYNVRIT
jgi:superfamily II DNA or RNA helicase